METYKFFVPGKPATAGSKSAFMIKSGPKKGRIIQTPANKNQGPWMDSVRWAFLQEYGRRVLLTGPIKLNVIFQLQRPKGHYGTGRNANILKPKYINSRPITKPDLTKLLRAVEDALKGLAWRDDSQVVEGVYSKLYADPSGAVVSISEP